MGPGFVPGIGYLIMTKKWEGRDPVLTFCGTVSLVEKLVINQLITRVNVNCNYDNCNQVEVCGTLRVYSWDTWLG